MLAQAATKIRRGIAGSRRFSEKIRADDCIAAKDLNNFLNLRSDAAQIGCLLSFSTMIIRTPHEASAYLVV